MELFSFNCSCSHVIKANQELYLFSLCFFTILITVAFIFAFSDFPEHQNWLINVVFLTLFVELHSKSILVFSTILLQVEIICHLYFLSFSTGYHFYPTFVLPSFVSLHFNDTIEFCFHLMLPGFTF